MKRLLKGFTLAEVLITLTIIGVIATLTVPSLNVSSQNQQNEVRLASTVSTIENAMSSMISLEGARNLYGTNAWGIAQNNNNNINKNSNPTAIAAFVGNLKQYLNITNFYNNEPSVYYGSNIKSMAGSLNWSGDSNASGNMPGNVFPVELKNGATLFVSVFGRGDGSSKTTAAERNAVINAGGRLFSDAADIFIDVNGKKGPNTIGRDLFCFYLGSDGVLYACGGVDVSIYDRDNNYASNLIWSNPNSGWACTDDVVKNEGWGCTGRVVAEGYKITY